MPLKIFTVALAVRWIYAFLLYATLGDAGLQTLDSTTYIGDAHSFAQAIEAGAVHGAGWLGPGIFTMPLFAWLTVLHALVFGKWASLAYVLSQGALDAGTCLLVYGIAYTLNPRFSVPASIAAALNPTQIVLSGLILTDTPFLFFVAAFLFAATLFLRAPAWRWAILCGLAIGAAAMIRAVVVPWTFFLLLFLILASFFAGRFSARIIAQLVAIAAIVGISISPVLWRNVSQYGAWSLTSQGGIHLAYWIVPLVQEARDGTPWPVGYEQIRKEMEERYPTESNNPFEQSRRYEALAREKLADLGPTAILKAWMFGAAINLASPAVTLSPVVSSLPRTGFYATPGTSMLDKAFNFLFRSDNAIYAWTILLGISGLAVMRLIQLIGLSALAVERQNWTILLLFFFWVAFILAVSGPVASPKYRLPIEPVLMVLAGAGLARLGLFARRAAKIHLYLLHHREQPEPE
jgi:4-amino-4-deoxy-L-arabinose transferase-like glycosyltransferase